MASEKIKDNITSLKWYSSSAWTTELVIYRPMIHELYYACKCIMPSLLKPHCPAHPKVKKIKSKGDNCRKFPPKLFGEGKIMNMVVYNFTKFLKTLVNH